MSAHETRPEATPAAVLRRETPPPARQVAGARPEEVAVLVQNRPFLGALLVHMPLFHALRRLYAGHRVVAYSPFAEAQLLAEERTVDDLVVYDGVIPLWRELRRRRPQHVFSFRRKSLRAGLAVAASGASTSVGFRYRMNGLLLGRTVPLSKRVYRALAFLDVLDLPPSVAHRYITELVRGLASASPWRPETDHSYYCLIPCCSDDRKQWGLSNYLGYCRAWCERDPRARFVFILGPKERALADEIADSDLSRRAVSLIEPNLSTIARVVLESRVTVSNDCAPGHIAQMSGAPSVSVFGDWDGAGGRRVGEWFYDRQGAACVIPGSPLPTNRIPVSSVFEASLRVAGGD